MPQVVALTSYRLITENKNIISNFRFSKFFQFQLVLPVFHVKINKVAEFGYDFGHGRTCWFCVWIFSMVFFLVLLSHVACFPTPYGLIILFAGFFML